MEQLKQMLEAYRNGERPMPTYAELAAISEAPLLTEAQISAGGRWMSDNSSSICCVNADDNWKIYGSEFLEEFRGALEVAQKAAK